MFGFFSKKPTELDSIGLCTSLANNATIDVVFEKGNYSGFLIIIDADGTSLADHFKYPEAQSAFIIAIEDRIQHRQFEDASVEIDMMMEMREITGWKPDMNVVRAVVGRGNKPLFTWKP